MSDSSAPLGPRSGEPQIVSTEALVEEVRSLRSSFHWVLLMLLVLVGSLFIFFLLELSIARRQIDELTKVVADYEKNTFPKVERFRSNLQTFAKNHPDFSPIYARYFGTNVAPPSTPGDDGGPRLPPGGPGR